MADLIIRGMEMPKERSLWLCVKTDGTVYNIKPGGIGTAHAVGTAVPLSVVSGEWASVHDGYGICSNCHRGDHIDPLAKFCRFCGAYIRKKVGGEDD